MIALLLVYAWIALNLIVIQIAVSYRNRKETA